MHDENHEAVSSKGMRKKLEAIKYVLFWLRTLLSAGEVGGSLSMASVDSSPIAGTMPTRGVWHRGRHLDSSQHTMPGAEP